MLLPKMMAKCLVSVAFSRFVSDTFRKPIHVDFPLEHVSGKELNEHLRNVMPDVGLTSSVEPLKEEYRVVIKYTVEIEGLPVYSES
jgi:hypothetical protein